METENKNWIGAEFLAPNTDSNNPAFIRYRVERLSYEPHVHFCSRNFSQDPRDKRTWWIETSSITRIYKRAPDADEGALVPEFFYRHVDIPLAETQYLPEDHFQHPNYDANKTKLRRAPGAGSYSEIHEGALYTYLDALYPDAGEKEGRVVKINHASEYCWIRTRKGNEVPMSLGRFIPLTRNGVPLTKAVSPEPAIETPTIDYKALAKNWRRFNV